MDVSNEWTLPGVDATKPSVARVHDALLGGTENFAVDRAIANRLKEAVPELGRLTWCNRAFIGRVVDFLVREAGIRQILDLGAGLPTIENTHEVAQFANPETRVVYVDIDPMVEPHARILLRENPHSIAITEDARNVDAILGHPQVVRHLDFSQPVAVMMIGLLHLFPDQDNPWGLVNAYMDAMPSGSYLAASNMFAAPNPKAKALEAMLHATMGTGFFRTREAITRYFDGLNLVAPGVVAFPQWHPDEKVSTPLENWEEILLGGVARKP